MNASTREMVIAMRAAAMDPRGHWIAETLLGAATLIERQAASIDAYRENDRNVEREIRDAWREGRADAEYEQHERERWGGYP